MNSDCAFYIGKTHHICQDYAMSGEVSGSPDRFAIVSDGCSSSPDTDWGSRILARNCYDRAATGVLPFLSLAVDAKFQATFLKLKPEAIDATLLVAETITASNRWSVAAFGDGVIARVRNDGAIEVSQIEYESGAPYYLNYLTDEKRHGQFIETFGSTRTRKDFTIFPDGKLSSVVKTEDKNPGFMDSGPIKDYKSIVVFSDGITSFMHQVCTDTSKMVEPVEMHLPLQELLAFKSYNGIFVQRRFQKFRKACEEKRWYHTDDLAMAAVYLGE